jgi:hypothetical protein
MISLLVTLRIVTGRWIAGPCQRCEARDRAAVDRAALDARRDYEDGVREVAELGVAQVEAYLAGVTERLR